jgi:hypothetical protein
LVEPIPINPIQAGAVGTPPSGTSGDELNQTEDGGKIEKSGVLLAFSMFWFSLGMLSCISKDIPYFNYDISIESRMIATFGPAVLSFLASGYLRIGQIRSLISLIPFKIVTKDEK